MKGIILPENKGRDNPAITVPDPGKGGDPVTCLSDHNGSQDDMKVSLFFFLSPDVYQ